jgi:hypothetical protein
MNAPRWIACLTVTAVFASPAAAEPPYPASAHIREIRWSPVESIVRQAAGSDNFPVTWADDDAIYTTFGDGFGFDPRIEKKLSLGFARISGPPHQFRAENVRSPAEQLGEGRSGKKGWGILSASGVLYLWLGHADQKGGQSQLAWSADHGRTWEFANWQLTELGMVGFVNFGRDYTGARDDFVYAYSHNGSRADTPADHFVMLRAPKGKLKERSAWEFLQEIDKSGHPVWTREIERRGAVFRHPGCCLRSAMTYVPALCRYLWWQQIPAPEGSRDRGDTRFAGGFGIYDAPEPWGPWTTAYYTEEWDVGPGEHADFPAKWMSADGAELHLVFSGEDSFSVRKATLTLAPAGAKP